jgi:hypothetical protein
MESKWNIAQRSNVQAATLQLSQDVLERIETIT